MKRNKIFFCPQLGDGHAFEDPETKTCPIRRRTCQKKTPWETDHVQSGMWHGSETLWEGGIIEGSLKPPVFWDMPGLKPIKTYTDG